MVIDIKVCFDTPDGAVDVIALLIRKLEEQYECPDRRNIRLFCNNALTDLLPPSGISTFYRPAFALADSIGTLFGNVPVYKVKADGLGWANTSAKGVLRYEDEQAEAEMHFTITTASQGGIYVADSCMAPCARRHGAFGRTEIPEFFMGRERPHVYLELFDSDTDLIEDAQVDVRELFED